MPIWFIAAPAAALIIGKAIHSIVKDGRSSSSSSLPSLQTEQENLRIRQKAAVEGVLLRSTRASLETYLKEHNITARLNIEPSILTDHKVRELLISQALEQYDKTDDLRQIESKAEKLERSQAKIDELMKSLKNEALAKQEAQGE